MADINAKDLKERGEKWMQRINDRLKAEEEWRKDAEAAETAYSNSETGEGEKYDFNMLFSNVETIVPSLYNSTPIPDIRVKYVSKDDGYYELLSEAAKTLECAVEAQLDDNVLDIEVEAGTQDAFLSGRGVIRVRFDADIETAAEVVEQEDPETGEMISQEITKESPVNERVQYEVVAWRDYVEGPAKRWEDVPWVAYRLFVHDEDMDQFDQAYMDLQKNPDDDQKKLDEHTIWEIWDKAKGQVIFVDASNSMLLKEVDDPLGLTGFFPNPRPVQPITLTGRRTPINPFRLYKTLAEEADRATRRINAIMKGLKVRGAVVGDAANIKRVAEADDNELIPIENVEGLAQTGGLDKAIVWWPVDLAITVVRELYTAREQTKQSIYEITGISDIVRGASNANETAHAQEIKTQWGSLRIRKMQRQIERMVRDLFVLSTEIIMNHFSDRRLNELRGKLLDEMVLEFLRQGLMQYAIDVESDSIIRGDLTRMKGEMGQFMQGAASYFQTMAPLVDQGGPEAAEPVIQIFSAFARMFNLGKQGEEALENLIDVAKKAAAQPRPNPGEEQAKADMAAKQGEIQARMAIEDRKLQAGAQSDAAKLQADERAREREAARKLQEFQAKVQAELLADERKISWEREKLDREERLKREEMAFQASMAALTASKESPDGDGDQAAVRALLSLGERVLAGATVPDAP